MLDEAFMALIIPPAIEQKIGAPDHGSVSKKDVEECFANHCGGYCDDKRPQHLDADGKPSMWFVAATNHGRILKIMFVRQGADMYLKSAYPATQQVQDIFSRHAK